MASEALQPMRILIASVGEILFTFISRDRRWKIMPLVVVTRKAVSTASFSSAVPETKTVTFLICVEV